MMFDMDHALGEMARVLKDKGVLVVQTKNLVYFRHRLSVLLGGQVRTSYFWCWDGNRLHYFTAPFLGRALELHGFRLRGILVSGRVHRLRSRWPRLLGSNLVVLATKDGPGPNDPVEPS